MLQALWAHLPKSAAAAVSSSTAVRTGVCGSCRCPPSLSLCRPYITTMEQKDLQSFGEQFLSLATVGGHDSYKKMRKQDNTEKSNLPLSRRHLLYFKGHK